MNVLSLFDGMSCGQIALERAGLDVARYYASEIDKHAIYVTQKNYPNTLQLGDVTAVDFRQLKNIDLLIGGSPCRNLSPIIQGNNHLNHARIERGLKGDSALFFQYVKALEITNASYFLFENVAGMRAQDKEIITKSLGVAPIEINSSLVSAQNRPRLYWTNIPNITQPQDKGIMLKDILEENVDEAYFYKNPFNFLGDDKNVVAELIFDFKAHDLVRRVYNQNGKCGALTSCRGGNLQKKVLDKGRVRKLTPTEYERLQTVPEGYTEGVSKGQRYNMLGDGWTVDVVAHIFKNML